MSKLKAFTLIELITVMAIIAVLMGGSIAVIISLRETSRLRSNVNDFVSEAKTKLNFARNSVYTQAELNVLSVNPSCSTIASTVIAPDATGYYFDPASKRSRQIKCAETQISTSSNFCCTIVTDLDNPNLSSEGIEYKADCGGVLFEYATGEVLRFNLGGTSAAMTPGSFTSVNAVSEKCSVEIKNTRINYAQTVTFDAENASIEIK